MIASMKARLDNREYFLKTHFFGKSLTVINKRKQLFQRRLYVLAILSLLWINGETNNAEHE